MSITSQRYEGVNATWPAGPLPKMTGIEALRAAKRLYRLVMERPWPGQWTIGRGNHRTYPRSGVFLVNPGQGWHDLVHDLSHQCFREMHPGARPHAPGHAYVERQMIAHVVGAGWLAGTLRPKAKPASTAADRAAARQARILDRIAAWESKRKRAENALKKLRRQRAYYERKGHAHA